MAKVFHQAFKKETREIRDNKNCYLVEVTRLAATADDEQEHVVYNLYNSNKKKLATIVGELEKSDGNQNLNVGTNGVKFKGMVQKRGEPQQSTIIRDNGVYDFNISSGYIAVDNIVGARHVASLLLGQCYDDLKRQSPDGRIYIETQKNQDLDWFQKTCLKFNNNYMVNNTYYSFFGNNEAAPIFIEYRLVNKMREKIGYKILEKWQEMGE